MGLYARHILPRLIDCACAMEEVTELRQRIVPRAQGRVLEIGVGSGLNLAHYDPTKVDSLVGIDPTQELLSMAEPRAAAASFPVQLLAESAERIPLQTQSFDTVVVTFTLCSIPDHNAALAEIRRLLKPAGKLYFCEHGRSDEHHISRWQDRINPIWKRLLGGCNLNRDISAAITNAGFRFDEIDAGYLSMAQLKIASYQYIGVAVPD